MNSRHRAGNVLGAKDMPFVAYYSNFGLNVSIQYLFLSTTSLAQGEKDSLLQCYKNHEY